MKLTVAGNQIALTEGATIGIERSSPLLNDDTGTFSFPFPVPTLPNQRILGWPGNLERVGDIPDQTFILEDSGEQVMRGEVDFDDITVDEIGMILKSGYTEFYKKMEGKNLGDVDYGGESWPINVSVVADKDALDAAIDAKIALWNEANITDNGKYVLSTFIIGADYTPYDIYVNIYNNTDGSSGLKYFHPGVQRTGMSYCLQFKVGFVIKKIFESAGYTVAEEIFSESDFLNKVIVFGNIISIYYMPTVNTCSPVMPSLQYAQMMPNINLLDFLDTIKNMFCLMYEIDELKREVRIKYKKDIFLPENLSYMKIKELAGWTHKEQKTQKGFTLRYTDQYDELATYTDYPEYGTAVYVLPAPTIEGQILSLISSIGRGREYLTVKTDAEVFEWKKVGRLREVKAGDGENETEINVRIPDQIGFQIARNAEEWNLECPGLRHVKRSYSSNITTISELQITLYHGIKMLDGMNITYSSFDRYSMDGTIDTGMSLKPAYLYDIVYAEFLNWQTYRARGFTKYIQLSIVDLIALQWGKRYMISGSDVILDKISYDLPFVGTIEIEGFTA